MTASDATPDPTVVVRIVAAVTARAATLGSARLVCIDGPAGSGKTTLATAIAAASTAPVVHMDDLLDGWDGLAGVGTAVTGLLHPLSRDEPGAYRRYDWTRQTWAGRVQVTPSPVLVLEGVGAGNREWSHWCTFLAWVETDAQTRLDRGMARDGEAMRGRWEQWMHDEDDLFTREQTRARADLVVAT